MHTNFPGLTIPQIVALAVFALIVVAVVLILIRNIHAVRLLRQLGEPRYQNAVAARAYRLRTQARYERPSRRLDTIRLRMLSPGDRRRFEQEWDAVEAHFVARPAGAVSEADHLLRDVMETRGYPVTDFEKRVADFSVNHPVVTRHYPLAHGIALRNRKGQATVEDLQRAMTHYRALFDDLVGEPISAFAAQFDYIPRPTFRS